MTKKPVHKCANCGDKRRLKNEGARTLAMCNACGEWGEFESTPTQSHAQKGGECGLCGAVFAHSLAKHIRGGHCNGTGDG